MAEASADKVAAQVCADERADGIQFDIESFDVTKDGQYYFYNQISKGLRGSCTRAARPPTPTAASTRSTPTAGTTRCFAFAASVDPANGNSAARVKDVFETNGKANGYFVDSLYDLGTGATGHLNDLPTYQNLVTTEVTHMKTWANSLGISYAFGIPASASAHEFTSCTGGCVAGADGFARQPDDRVHETSGRGHQLRRRTAGSAVHRNQHLVDGVVHGDLAVQLLPVAASHRRADLARCEPAPAPRRRGTGTTTPTPTPHPDSHAHADTGRRRHLPETQLITNGGFENNLTGWSCDGTYSVDSVAASGTHGVRLTPSATVTSVCSQTVSVVSGKQYTLSAQNSSRTGAYISVGVKNGAEVTSNASTFTSDESSRHGDGEHDHRVRAGLQAAGPETPGPMTSVS